MNWSQRQMPSTPAFPYSVLTIHCHLSKTFHRLSKRGQDSMRERELVSWWFEPSQPQRMTSGLNTNLTVSPGYSFHESSYHKSCFLSLFIFCGHSTREPASGRVTYFILRACTGTMCTANTGEIRRGFACLSSIDKCHGWFN